VTPTPAGHAVKAVAIQEGRCPVCDERSRRQATFVERVTLFRPADEAMDLVTARSVEWEPDFTHRRCAEEVPV